MVFALNVVLYCCNINLLPVVIHEPALDTRLVIANRALFTILVSNKGEWNYYNIIIIVLLNSQPSVLLNFI